MIVSSQSLPEKAIQVRCGWRDIALPPCEDATQYDAVRSTAHQKRVINGKQAQRMFIILDARFSLGWTVGLLAFQPHPSAYPTNSPSPAADSGQSKGYPLGIFMPEAPRCYMTSLRELDRNYSASTFKFNTDLSRLQLRRSDIPRQPPYLLYSFRMSVGARSARS